jgi:GntR family transcriptional repressor for pyruvate dehydrogenase complex
MAQNVADKVPGLNISEAKPVRLFEQAVEQIKGLITNGLLKPGDKLPGEHVLSQTMKVSRSSVREALRSLESTGLIQVRSGSGAFVAEDALLLNSLNVAVKRLIRREELVLQLLQVRSAIECLTVSLAAVRITQTEIERLQANLDKQESIVLDRLTPENLNELSQLDVDFHVALSRSSGNELVCEIVHALLPPFKEDNRAIFTVEKGLKLVEEHRSILCALSCHNPVEAEASMRKHIQRVIDEIQNLEQSYKQGIPEILQSSNPNSSIEPQD